MFLRPCGSFSGARPVTVTTKAGSVPTLQAIVASSSRSPAAIEVGVPLTSTPPRAISWGWAGGSAAPGGGAGGRPGGRGPRCEVVRSRAGHAGGLGEGGGGGGLEGLGSSAGVAFDAMASPAGMTSGAGLEAITARRARGADARARPVAEQAGQAADARVEGGGSEVVLVGDLLVVEREDVGDVGPPVQDLQAEVAARGRLPDVQFGFAVEVPQQRVAEGGEIACPVGDPAQPGGVADRRPAGRVARQARRASAGLGAGRHLPPSTTMRTEPRSGQLGSPATRMISSRATVTTSGIGTNSGM